MCTYRYVNIYLLNGRLRLRCARREMGLCLPLRVTQHKQAPLRVSAKTRAVRFGSGFATALLTTDLSLEMLRTSFRAQKSQNQPQIHDFGVIHPKTAHTTSSEAQ